jgi:hypothetical protein
LDSQGFLARPAKSSADFAPAVKITAKLPAFCRTDENNLLFAIQVPV